MRLEAELVELDASALALCAHPDPKLREQALVLAVAVRDLFFARKAAYDRAVTERLEVLDSGLHDADDAVRERDELNQRLRRAEHIEDFAADLIDRERDGIVRRALRRELLESKVRDLPTSPRISSNLITSPRISSHLPAPPSTPFSHPAPSSPPRVGSPASCRARPSSIRCKSRRWRSSLRCRPSRSV